MNTRLQKEYARMRAWGEESLRSGDIQVDELFGAECFGITVQIPLPSSLQHAIGSLQEELVKEVPHGLILQPVDTLHVTVDPVILWSHRQKTKKQQQWFKIEEDCRKQFLQLRKLQGAIPIVFRECIAVKNAVFLGAYDEHDQFADLRAYVRTALGAPEDTPFRNTIIHCVIACYASQAIDVDSLLSFTKHNREPMAMVVETVELRKELQYPAQNIEVLERVTLAYVE